MYCNQRIKENFDLNPFGNPRPLPIIRLYGFSLDQTTLNKATFPTLWQDRRSGVAFGYSQSWHKTNLNQFTSPYLHSQKK